MSDATYAIRLTLAGAGAVTSGVRSVFGAIGGGASVIAAANQHLFYLGSNIAGLIRAGANAGRTGLSLVESIVGPNEQYETAVLGFTQLLGSAEAAQQRITDLYAYANSTPFKNDEVLSAGRILQAFGGNALGAGAGLKMTGNMAAYANKELGEVAMWVGRAYSAINAGQPFGEAAQRLQEMTLLTGEERLRLEDLSKAGAPPAEIWAAFVQIMAKADGATDKLGNSMRGLKSTISGQWDEIKRLLGERLFEAMKADLMGIRDTIDAAFQDGRIQRWTKHGAEAIRGLYEDIKKLSFVGLKAEQLLTAAESGKLVEMLKVAIEVSASNFGVAALESARKYGPEIISAMVGDNARLRTLLGLDRTKNMKDFIEGPKTYGEAYDALPTLDKIRMYWDTRPDYKSVGGNGAFGGGILPMAEGSQTDWIRRQIEAATPNVSRPHYRDLNAELIQRGIIGPAMNVPITPVAAPMSPRDVAQMIGKEYADAPLAEEIVPRVVEVREEFKKMVSEARTLSEELALIRQGRGVF